MSLGKPRNGGFVHQNFGLSIERSEVVPSHDNWSPPKLVPPDHARQNGWSPRTVYGRILGPPGTVPHVRRDSPAKYTSA